MFTFPMNFAGLAFCVMIGISCMSAQQTGTIQNQSAVLSGSQSGRTCACFASGSPMAKILRLLSLAASSSQGGSIQANAYDELYGNLAQQLALRIVVIERFSRTADFLLAHLKNSINSLKLSPRDKQEALNKINSLKVQFALMMSELIKKTEKDSLLELKERIRLSNSQKGLMAELLIQYNKVAKDLKMSQIPDISSLNKIIASGGGSISVGGNGGSLFSGVDMIKGLMNAANSQTNGGTITFSSSGGTNGSSGGSAGTNGTSSGMDILTNPGDVKLTMKAGTK